MKAFRYIVVFEWLDPNGAGMKQEAVCGFADRQLAFEAVQMLTAASSPHKNKLAIVAYDTKYDTGNRTRSPDTWVELRRMIIRGIRP